MIQSMALTEGRARSWVGQRLFGWLVWGRMWRERCITVLSYYHNWRFAAADLSLGLLALFDNPYRRTRLFFRRQRRLSVPYGETPPSVMSDAVQRMGWHSGDTIAELGCGTGRVAFWLALHLRSHVHAIDCQPSFARRIFWIARIFGIRRIHARCADLRLTDLSRCTAAYFYCTGFPEDLLKRITPSLMTLPRGARLLTVSLPVQDWDPTAPFELIDQWTAHFPWGDATLFLQVRR